MTPTTRGRAKPPTTPKARTTAKKADAADRTAPRTTVLVQGARVHNLRDVTVEFPRDRLTVVTGLSGSGKSSLAFDTVYAEGQRRYLESLSSFAKRFIAQVAKPDVDYVFGLSPVISIEQKTTGSNPRSTVGTMTDVASYLNLLWATAATATCPWCDARVPIRTSAQTVEAIRRLPEGTTVELRAVVFRRYDQDDEELVTEVRRAGYRRLVVDGAELDLTVTADLPPRDARLEVVVDRFEVTAHNERLVQTALANAVLVGDQLVTAHVVDPAPAAGPKTAAKRRTAANAKTKARSPARPLEGFGCPDHATSFVDIGPDFFQFNNPLAACQTCGGLGTTRVVVDELLVPDPSRSIAGGCFLREAYRYNPDTFDGLFMYSLSVALGFDLDTPWADLPADARRAVLHGTAGRSFVLHQPPGGKPHRAVGQEHSWPGIAQRIARAYRRYRERAESHSGMEAWLDAVMVDQTCPACEGSRLRPSRRLFTVADLTVIDANDTPFADLAPWLRSLGLEHAAAAQVRDEIAARVDLLLGIGLDYLTFSRRSSTLSGGEAQRIRLSTQIGSGLMGMLYVLDEPSIGLHPKDNVKMIATLRKLVDLGNTVLVVEHDEDTIEAADHLIEMGPGPGVHGGTVVASGTLDDLAACPASPTGQFSTGARRIELPAARRPLGDRWLVVRGAAEHNLRDIDVEIPLGGLVCLTGASGSGKSTLLHEIVYKVLHKTLVDSRTLPGAHRAVEGLEHVTRAVKIDQAPIGRTSRSNPATYVGFYDDIRTLFATTPAAEARGYKPGRFSFNVAGGRCPECNGEGAITTPLYFMPDMETTCGACKGTRFLA
ncbi:MAG TPA: excinuclease ABC subunit UvrA, partial [Acidimicrobiales bacterium]